MSVLVMQIAGLVLIAISVALIPYVLSKKGRSQLWLLFNPKAIDINNIVVAEIVNTIIHDITEEERVKIDNTKEFGEFIDEFITDLPARDVINIVKDMKMGHTTLLKKHMTYMVIKYLDRRG